LSAILSALAPVLALILLGFALRRGGFLGDAAWAGIERLTYFVLFPALLVRTLGRQDPSGLPWPSMLLVALLAVGAVSLTLVLWRRIQPIGDGATFTSVFQGGVRFNTYVGLAVIQALLGADGVGVGAVVFGFMIPLVNLLCISAFAVWGTGAVRGVRPFVTTVLGNPLIIACMVGWALGLSGIGLPGISADVLEIIGRAALPLGLLAVGAALRPEQIRGHLAPAAQASLIQFGLKPLLALGLCAAFGLDPLVSAVFLIVLMTPTASSAYILARQLGGDTAAMASIITLQTLLAFAVMPLVFWLALDGR
jgi:malonate transporter